MCSVGPTDPTNRIEGSEAGGSCLIRAHQIDLQYGRKAVLSNFCINVQPGSITCLMGKNGSGKTSAIRVLSGLVQPLRGDVWYEGYSLTESPVEAKSRFGYVADKAMVLVGLTGWEYIGFICSLYGMTFESYQKRASDLVDRFQLNDVIDKKVGLYSHGSQHKIAMVAQFSHNPRVMLMDEPGTGLDRVSLQEMIGLLHEYRSQGNSVLMTTHLQDLADHVCDSMYLIDDGRIVNAEVDEQLSVSRGLSSRKFLLPQARESL